MRRLAGKIIANEEANERSLTERAVTTSFGYFWGPAAALPAGEPSYKFLNMLFFAMLEPFTTWSDPLALVRHLLPFLPTADGHVRAHWTMARAMCSIAEQVVLRTTPRPDAPLSALSLAEVSAGTDELGRLLLRHLPFDDITAQQAWPQVQAYLLLVLPLVEQLLVAEAPAHNVA